MTVTTKAEARRIAYFGAKKMDAQGYTYQRLDVWNWQVNNPAGGFYTVSIYESGDAFCGCKFFEENAQFGACKHTARVGWLKAEADRQAEEDAIADYYASRLDDAEGPGGCISHPHVSGLGV